MNIQRKARMSAMATVSGISTDLQRRVADSLQVGNPKANGHALPTENANSNECPMTIGVMEVRAYEDNPRRSRNPRFDEIKESIRSGGIRSPLTVTRRPGETHYITEAGGNTRLLATQELWNETRDPRFEKITVLFRPWRSESHVLGAHLIENDLRGDIGFWDKAVGITALKAKLEAEQGRSLSTRQLDDALRALGLTVNLSTLTHCLFATSRLRTLGQGISDLSGLHVRQIQPRLNVLKRYAQIRGGSNEPELYAAVFEPVFARHVTRWAQQGRFDAETLCHDCDEALATHLGERLERLRTLLEMQSRSPQSSIEHLLAQADAEEVASDPRTATPGIEGAERHTSNAEPSLAPKRLLPPSSAEPLEDSLMRCVARCAELTGIQQYVRISVDAPLGYYMDVPEHALDPMQRRAWWLFVLLAGQLGRPNEVPGRSFNWAAELATAISQDRTLLDWLLDANDPAAATIWELVVLAKATRSTRPPLVGAGAS